MVTRRRGSMRTSAHVTRGPILLVAALAACIHDPDEVEPRPAWTQTAPLPAPRVDVAVTALGQRVTVYGGREAGVLTSSTIALDPLEETWNPLPDAPIALADANLATVSATLYLLGGLDDTAARGESYALDAAFPEPTWRELPPMPAGLERGAAAVVVFPPNIFVLGGATPSGAVSSNLAFNTIANEWTVLPPLPAPRSHGAAMRMPDGTLIFAGGRDGDQAFSNVYALRLLGSRFAMEWEERSPMPTARGGCAYGTVVDQLICAGGEAGDTVLAVNESYDPFRDVWTLLPLLPEPRTGTRGAVVGGRLFVPGGTASAAREPTSTVYVFSFLDTLAP